MKSPNSASEKTSFLKKNLTNTAYAALIASVLLTSCGKSHTTEKNSDNETKTEQVDPEGAWKEYKNEKKTLDEKKKNLEEKLKEKEDLEAEIEKLKGEIAKQKDVVKTSLNEAKSNSCNYEEITAEKKSHKK